MTWLLIVIFLLILAWFWQNLTKDRVSDSQKTPPSDTSQTDHSSTLHTSSTKTAIPSQRYHQASLEISLSPDAFLEEQKEKRAKLLKQGSYLSVERINTYRSCPFKFYLKYIKGIEVTKSYPLLVGSAVHTGIAYIYTNKLRRDNLPPFNKVLQVYNKALTDEELKNQQQVNSYLRKKGEDILRSYLYEEAHYITPMLVEWGFRVYMMCDLDFLGFVDLITPDGRLIEHKVKLSNFLDPEAEIERTKMQITAYALAFKQINGKKASTEIHFLLPGKTKKYLLSVTDEDIENFKNIFTELSSRLTRAQYSSNPAQFFAPVSTYKCSSCSYQSKCLQAQREVKNTPIIRNKEAYTQSNRKIVTVRGYGNPPVSIKQPGGPRSKPKTRCF